MIKTNNFEKEKVESVKELLSLGVSKGFLTFKEINESLSQFVTERDELDAILFLIEQSTIEIVETEKKYQKTKSQADYLVEDGGDETDSVEGLFDDIETISGGVSDPVRLYLRKMGGVSLLSRDGEIEIARRIEDGENRILNVVFNSELGISGIVDLADKLKKGRYRVSDLVKGGDDIENSINEATLEKKILESIDLIQKAFIVNVVLEAKLKKLTKEQSKQKIREEIGKNKEKMRESFREINLNRKTINK
ncbi:MAG: RNA polymerase sigma factor region1.1 domain-containing protein, partial [Pseudomonadota bacterium]